MISLFCSDCGSDVETSARFCANCGARVASKREIIDIPELTKSLIEKQLKPLSGYGSEPSDRAIIEEEITKLFNDIHSKTIGGPLFTYDPKTRFCESDTTDEIDVVGPQIIEVILNSDQVQNSIRPIISTFINWFVLSINIPIEPRTMHIMFLANLEDSLSDANIAFFGLTNNFELVKNFYNSTFPDGKDEFFGHLESIAEQAPKGQLQTLPGTQSPFETNTDRKDYWKIVLDLYRQSFYPVITTVNDVLVANSWLNEYVSVFENYSKTFLKDEFVSVVQCHEMVTGNKSPAEGKDKILLFSNSGICEIYANEKHRRGTSPSFYPVEQIQEISIGTEIHEAHGGFSSKVSTFMVVVIHTTSHQVHTKYVYLGENEQETNVNRPKFMTKLTQISRFYPLAEGDFVQSSSGYTLSPSIGIWHPIN
jgi:hypothetical protein